MRLFFGLKPRYQSALEIDAWRQRALPPFMNPVGLDNLHITLAFLGKVSDRQLEPLSLLTDEIRISDIELTLNELGYWSKPGVLWIGTREKPEPLLELAGLLGGIRRRLGLHSDSRSYSPHLTIARNCETAPPASVIEPEFTMAFDHFGLFESVRTRSGLRYEVRQEWELCGP